MGSGGVMRDQTIGQPQVRSLALAEAAQHVRFRWILGLSLASLGMWMANQTPLQVMLALQLQDITPRHKIPPLGVVTGVGAVSSALATPLPGPGDGRGRGRPRPATAQRVPHPRAPQVCAGPAVPSLHPSP